MCLFFLWNLQQSPSNCYCTTHIPYLRSRSHPNPRKKKMFYLYVPITTQFYQSNPLLIRFICILFVKWFEIISTNLNFLTAFFVWLNFNWHIYNTIGQKPIEVTNIQYESDWYLMPKCRRKSRWFYCFRFTWRKSEIYSVILFI